MATTNQFYVRQAVTSTGASVAIGFVAREAKIDNLSTALTLYCQFDGEVASTASYPLAASASIQFRNLASSILAFNNASTATTIDVDILGLQ